MMGEFRADLHCHSLFSDGSLTPEELIDLALLKNLSALSITDHDTIGAYSRALPYAKEKNLLLLTGVELSTTYGPESIHVLGYGFQPTSQEILRFCENQQKIRQERNLAIVIKLKRLGITLDEKVFIENPHFGRPHIAKFMMEKGVVSSLQDAFHKYLGEGKPAYDPGRRISVEEAISSIKKGGGLAILAHPHLIVRKRILKALLQLPFDGIECYYGRMPRDRVTPFLQAAKERKWLISGGSDFHGATKPESQLGSSWIPHDDYERIRKAL